MAHFKVVLVTDLPPEALLGTVVELKMIAPPCPHGWAMEDCAFCTGAHWFGNPYDLVVIDNGLYATREIAEMPLFVDFPLADPDQP